MTVATLHQLRVCRRFGIDRIVLANQLVGRLERRAKLEAHQSFRDLEFPRMSNDGKMRWVSVSGYPIFDDAGKFRGYRGVGHDITARKRNESLVMNIARGVSAKIGDSFGEIRPYATGFRAEVEIDFTNPVIGQQSYAFDLNPERFRREVGRADERVVLEGFLTEPRQTVDSPAKIGRLERDQDLHLWRDLEHHKAFQKLRDSASTSAAS